MTIEMTATIILCILVFLTAGIYAHHVYRIQHDHHQEIVACFAIDIANHPSRYPNDVLINAREALIEYAPGMYLVEIAAINMELAMRGHSE